MSVQITDPLVTVNNDSVGIVPNSLTYTEGKGEQSIMAASLGGDQTDQVYAHNIESNFATIKFEMYSTVENIAKADQWKSLRNTNVVQITASNADGNLTRSFTQAAILNDYEVNLGTEANIAVEFKSNPAI